MQKPMSDCLAGEPHDPYLRDDENQRLW